MAYALCVNALQEISFCNSYGPFYRLLYLEVGRKLKNLLWNSAKLMNTLKFLQNIIMSFITIYMTNQQSLTSLGNKLVIAGALVHSGWAINECCKLRFFFFVSRHGGIVLLKKY